MGRAPFLATGDRLQGHSWALIECAAFAVCTGALQANTTKGHVSATVFGRLYLGVELDIVYLVPGGFCFKGGVVTGT